MRITNAAQLSQLKSANKVSSAAAAQIEAALKQSTAGSAEDAGSLKSSISHHRRSVKSGERGESKGEASVRLALVSAFGDWNAGGEVVQELIPFSTRAFRADFALPRWKLCLEVLLTPADILMQTRQAFIASMHTGMNLVAREL